MPDETTTTEETPENPISQDIGVNMDSIPSNTTPEALQDPTAVSTPEVVNNTAPINTENKAETAENEQNAVNTLENQIPDIEPKSEPITEPVKASEPSTESQDIQADKRTAQIPVVEPLIVSTSTKLSQKDLWKRFLDKVQIGKRKKLEKIITMFAKQTKVTNDEVEKFLHVSDATAERYLNILEKENKIKQTGKTGHSVFYVKI